MRDADDPDPPEDTSELRAALEDLDGWLARLKELREVDGGGGAAPDIGSHWYEHEEAEPPGITCSLCKKPLVPGTAAWTVVKDDPAGETCPVLNAQTPEADASKRRHDPVLLAAVCHDLVVGWLGSYCALVIKRVAAYERAALDAMQAPPTPPHRTRKRGGR